jgi:hypothetical protein
MHVIGAVISHCKQPRAPYKKLHKIHQDQARLNIHMEPVLVRNDQSVKITAEISEFFGIVISDR